MPIIEGELVLPGDEAIEEGKIYKVVEVQKIDQRVRGFPGYDVILDGGRNTRLSVSLWSKERIGRRSKIGAFVLVLGRNTDDWIGKQIRFIAWQPRKRQIELVK